MRLWQVKRDFQIDFLRRHGLQPADVLVDVGCGTLRGGIPIIDYLEPRHYVGIDVRAEAIEAARAELREHGLEAKEPALIVAPSLAALELGRTADVIWAFSLFMHLDDARLDECLDFVRRHLGDQGVFYANVITAPMAPERWREFPVLSRPLERYAALAAQHGLALRDLGSLASLGHVSGLPHHDEEPMLEFRRAGTAQTS